MKKSVVDHTYRDFSEVTLSDLGDSLEHWNADLFPAKLHKILSNPEYAHIIAWKSHGRAWEVLDRSLFLEVVLPNHFNHRNSGSFNRSVNGWGFKVRVVLYTHWSEMMLSESFVTCYVISTLKLLASWYLVSHILSNVWLYHDDSSSVLCPKDPITIPTIMSYFFAVSRN